MTADDARTPPPVAGLYDRPMWASITARAMRLQCCRACSGWQYPPGPACPHCLSDALDWREISGEATLLSWVVFHRQYLAAYPTPFNCIAARLKEGPVMISNLSGGSPDDTAIGRPLRLVYETMADGAVLPRFEFADGGAGERS